jgi:hypothetical protein
MKEQWQVDIESLVDANEEIEGKLPARGTEQDMVDGAIEIAKENIIKKIKDLPTEFSGDGEDMFAYGFQEAKKKILEIIKDNGK